MDKTITQEKINIITKLVYDLRCPAPEWEAFKKILAELPDAKVEKKEDEQV